MVTPTATAAQAVSLPFDHELACEHGVVGWLACQTCNTIMDGRLFECQMYGRHQWHVDSDIGPDSGSEYFTCTHCEWEREVIYY